MPKRQYFLSRKRSLYLAILKSWIHAHKWRIHQTLKRGGHNNDQGRRIPWWRRRQEGAGHSESESFVWPIVLLEFSSFMFCLLGFNAWEGVSWHESSRNFEIKSKFSLMAPLNCSGDQFQINIKSWIRSQVFMFDFWWKVFMFDFLWNVLQTAVESFLTLTPTIALWPRSIRRELASHSAALDFMIPGAA